MAPLPEENTIRLKCKYSGPFGTHTMTFRGTSTATPSTFRDQVESVVQAMSHCQWQGTNWLDTELAPAGSNIFNPQPPFGITATELQNPTLNDSPSVFLQWGGRDGAGRRVKLYLFEVWTPPRNDMRYAFGENGFVDAVYTALAAADQIATISGETPLWKSYANVGENDHLTHKARG